MRLRDIAINSIPPVHFSMKAALINYMWNVYEMCQYWYVLCSGFLHLTVHVG